LGKFKDLRVWQEATEEAVAVYQMTFDGQLEKDFTLKDQLRRSAISIPSTLAERDELGTDKQATNFFSRTWFRSRIANPIDSSQMMGYIDIGTL
jgi:hypothetical protein